MCSSALLVCCPAEARAPAWTVSSTAWWRRWEVKDWGKDVIEGVGRQQLLALDPELSELRS